MPQIHTDDAQEIAASGPLLVAPFAVRKLLLAINLDIICASLFIKFSSGVIIKSNFRQVEK